MKINIIAIGKMKPSPEKQIIEKYLQRLSWQVEIKELEEKKKLSGEKLKQAEGRLLLNNTPHGAKIIALDERGKHLTSIEFSQQIQQLENGNCSQLAFLIGGADGHSNEVKSKADLLLSLSKMAWPHMMVRAMLSEQLYRAYTIKIRHPYHRE